MSVKKMCERRHMFSADIKYTSCSGETNISVMFKSGSLHTLHADSAGGAGVSEIGMHVRFLYLIRKNYNYINNE
jgi:hypothetical protein